jgi:DNA-directed RNA polymerase specialized sigma24 family protein
VLSPSPMARRSRALRRAPEPVRRLAAVRTGRDRVHVALARCSEHERAVLALLLVEHLTPLEAAAALGLPLREVLRTYRALMAELTRVARGLRFRPLRAPAATVESARRA